MNFEEFRKTKEYEELPKGQLYIPDERCLFNTARGRVAEIGCLCGRSAVLMSYNAKSVSTFDIFENYDLIEDDKQREHYKDLVSIFPHSYEIVKKNLLKYPSIEVIEGTSEKLPIYASLIGYFDFIFIDGDHSYNGAKKDFENALKALAPDGIIAFHDSNVHEEGMGVWKLMDELKKDARYNLQEQEGVITLLRLSK